MAPPAIDVKKPNLKRTRNSLEKLESIGKNPENKSAAQVALERYIYIINTKPGRFCSPFDHPFNALYLHRVLCIKFLDGYEKQDPIKLEFKLGKKRLVYHSKASSFGKDLCALSFFYGCCGTDIPSIMESLEQNAKTVFQFLVDRYSVQSTESNEETITLKRLGNVYPNAICVAYNRKMATMPISLEQIFLNDSFPSCFACPNLINCVPDRFLKDLVPFTFLCALEIEQTKSRTLVKRPTTLLTDIWFHHVAAFKSGMLYCDSTRNEFMEQLDINEQLVARLQEFLPNVMEKIKEMLGDSSLAKKILQDIQEGNL